MAETTVQVTPSSPEVADKAPAQRKVPRLSAAEMARDAQVRLDQPDFVVAAALSFHEPGKTFTEAEAAKHVEKFLNNEVQVEDLNSTTAEG
jgi:hypothetical protein